MEPYLRQTLIRNLFSGVITLLFLNYSNKDSERIVHREGQNLCNPCNTDVRKPKTYGYYTILAEKFCGMRDIALSLHTET